MVDTSANHGLDLNYADGASWDYNQEMQYFEETLTIRDAESNTGNYDPYVDAEFLATDTGAVFIGDGTNWNQLTHGSLHESGGSDEIDVTGLSGDLADPQDPKSHGNEAHDSTFLTSGDQIAQLIRSPNGTPMTGLLEDGDALEISVPVAANDTLTVYRWGGYLLSDGTAPSGLEVRLLDGSDTVQSSENTVNTENLSGVTSYTNSSGSRSIFKLRVYNGTGSNYTTDGVGGVFAYEVS